MAACRIDRRNNFKRRRMFVDDKDIDYINERNKVYNEKLERHFNKYAADFKAGMERGSAQFNPQ